MIKTYKEMHEKYNEISNKQMEFPYFYKHIKENKILYFLGAQHSNDIEHPQFSKMEEYFKQFLQEVRTNKNNSVILIEGTVGPIKEEDTREQLVREYGEVGVALYLGYKNNISVVSAEPNVEDQIFEMLKKYTKEEVVLFYFLNIVYQWVRSESKESIEEYYPRYLFDYTNNSYLEHLDISLEHMKKLYKNTFHKDFNPREDIKTIYDYINPTDENISGADGTIRDTHILKQVQEYWKENNLFIVYGSGHSIRLEKSLIEE